MVFGPKRWHRKVLLKVTDLNLPRDAGISRDLGTTGPHQCLFNTLTLFRGRGQKTHHHIVLSPPRFFKFRRPKHSIILLRRKRIWPQGNGWTIINWSIWLGQTSCHKKKDLGTAKIIWDSSIFFLSNQNLTCDCLLISMFLPKFVWIWLIGT